MTTLESLCHFDCRGYNLVIIDECEAVNMTFLTDALKSTLPNYRYEKAVRAYGELLYTAKKVIMCDGLLMKRTLKFIDDIKGKSDGMYVSYYYT